jgi:hypothetical protein
MGLAQAQDIIDLQTKEHPGTRFRIHAIRILCCFGGWDYTPALRAVVPGYI